MSCVIAKSFARIFYRNAINIGLPILECDDAVDGTDAGDELEVDLESGAIRNLTKGATFQAKPYPPFMLELMRAGGLVEYTKKRLAGKDRSSREDCRVIPCGQRSGDGNRRDRPSLRAFFTNWRESKLPFHRKLALTFRNHWIRLRTRQRLLRPPGRARLLTGRARAP